MKTAVANGKNLSYTYNSDGTRTSKTVDGATTTYFLDGSTIMAQKSGSDVMWFVYDSDGTRVGFTYNGVTYHYLTNAQGDVTGITDVDDNLVVEYSYDAWGKLLSTTGTMADTLGVQNPFLYRGYYYDTETGLYYLNSRYYDPQTGRFINADSAIGVGADIGSYNMFTYCENNPISRSDSSGQYFGLDDLIAGAVGLVAGVASQLVSDIVTSSLNNKWKFSNWQTYTGAAVGGAIGGVLTLYTGPVVGTAAAAGVSTLLGQTLENITTGGKKRTTSQIVFNTAVSTATGAVAGKFLPTKVPGVTTGRNSMAAVFSSGITKIKNNVASRMSAKVLGKGIASSVISDFGSSSFNGFTSFLSDANVSAPYHQYS